MRPLTKKGYWALTLLALVSSALVVAGGVDYDAARKAMVATLRGQGIRHSKTLEAMGKVPRHEFVPEGQRSRAYRAAEIPVGRGQVLASPYLVALMTQTLDPKPEMKVLEVGTGCGYQTAILAELCSRVYTVERDSRLADAASERLKSLGYKSVRYGAGEEAKGWPTHAPYEAILVTRGVGRVPEALVEQLADGGCLVVAIGHGPEQTLDRMRKVGGKLRVEAVIPVRMSGPAPPPRGR